MNNTEEYLKGIEEIRKMMEKSTRFLTLSGLSGVMTGIYALSGAAAAGIMINTAGIPFTLEGAAPELIRQLVVLGLVIIFLAVSTIVILTRRRARNAEKKFWNTGSRHLLLNLTIPLLTGGVFMIVLLMRGDHVLLIPVSLLFYGLALVNAAKFTYQEIFYLGLIQIFLGLMSAVFPMAGLFLWASGFGLVHIIYGALMYYRYETVTKLRKQ